MSGWAAVGSRLVGAVGSRLVRAVGRGAGRSGRAVGLRGFASPDVLKYCLAVFGIPVSNYSDKRGRFLDLKQTQKKFAGSNGASMQ